MTIVINEDEGVGAVAAQLGQELYEDHGIFDLRWTQSQSQDMVTKAYEALREGTTA